MQRTPQTASVEAHRPITAQAKVLDALSIVIRPLCASAERGALARKAVHTTRLTSAFHRNQIICKSRALDDVTVRQPAGAFGVRSHVKVRGRVGHRNRHRNWRKSGVYARAHGTDALHQIVAVRPNGTRVRAPTHEVVGDGLARQVRSFARRQHDACSAHIAGRTTSTNDDLRARRASRSHPATPTATMHHSPRAAAPARVHSADSSKAIANIASRM